MKKILALIFCLCMLFSLAACGDGGDDGKGKFPMPEDSAFAVSETDKGPSGTDDVISEKALMPGEKNVSDGYASFSLIKIWTTDTVTASNSGRVLEAGEGNVYIDAVFNFENLTGEELYSNEVMTLSAKDGSGKEYTDAAFSFEEEDQNGIPFSVVSGFTSLQAHMTSRLHCALKVPEGTPALDLKYTVKNTALSYKYTPGEEVTTAKEISIGDKLEKDGFASLEFLGTEYTRLLSPADKSGSYYSINIQGTNAENEQFLAVKFNLKNEAKETLNCKAAVGITAQYQGSHTYCMDKYESNAVVEKNVDLPGFTDSIDGGETCPFYYLLNVDRNFKNEAFTLHITFGGDEYIYRSGEITEKPKIALSSETLAVGAELTFGKYEQDNDTSNGKEDIEWIVLDNVDGYWLLISKYALEVKPFNSERTDCMWADSSLRNFLNDSFKKEAFTDSERILLKERTNPALIGTNKKLKYGSDTVESIFVLSRSEAEKYFKTDEERICYATDYVIGKEALTGDSTSEDGKPSVSWWLRNHANDNPCASDFVWYSGKIEKGGGSVTNDHDCVRPCIWVQY